jgi:hypothetical protein
MKNRIIKSGIIVAVVTLVMFNIQVLSDTTDNPFFPGSTVSAVEDPNQPANYFYPLHKLDNIKCWVFDVDLSLSEVWGIVVPSISIHFDTNARRWACIRENQIIYCDSRKMTECKSIAED